LASLLAQLYNTDIMDDPKDIAAVDHMRRQSYSRRLGIPIEDLEQLRQELGTLIPASPTNTNTNASAPTGPSGSGSIARQGTVEQGAKAVGVDQVASPLARGRSVSTTDAVWASACV
jgi:hypothetical protein